MKKFFAFMLMMLFMFSNATAYAADDMTVKIKALNSDAFSVELINNSSKDIKNITVTADISDDLAVIKSPNKIVKLAKGSSEEVKFRVKKATEKDMQTAPKEKSNTLYIGLGVVGLAILGFFGFKVAKAKQILLAFIIVGGLLNSTHSAEAATDAYKKEITLFEKNVTVIVKIEYGNEKESTSKKQSIKSSKSSDTHVTYNQTQNNVTVINDSSTDVAQKIDITNESNEQIVNQTNVNQKQVNIKSNTHVNDVAEKIEIKDDKSNDVTKTESKATETSKVEDKGDTAEKIEVKDDKSNGATKTESKATETSKVEDKDDTAEKVEVTDKKEDAKKSEFVVQNNDEQSDKNSKEMTNTDEKATTEGFSKQEIEQMKDPKVTEQYSEQYDKVYQDVIQKYQKLYVDNSNMLFLDSRFIKDQYNIKYTFVDLNHDDVPELIVAGEKDDYFTIDNIFSQQDNKISPIFDSYKYQPSFGRKTNLVLYKNGLWVLSSSGANSHSVQQFKLDKDSKVKLLNEYSQDGDNYMFNNQIITQETYGMSLQDLEAGRIDLREFNWYKISN